MRRFSLSRQCMCHWRVWMSQGRARKMCVWPRHGVEGARASSSAASRVLRFKAQVPPHNPPAESLLPAAATDQFALDSETSHIISAPSFVYTHVRNGSDFESRSLARCRFLAHLVSSVLSGWWLIAIVRFSFLRFKNVNVLVCAKPTGFLLDHYEIVLILFFSFCPLFPFFSFTAFKPRVMFCAWCMNYLGFRAVCACS